jgi:hypothetical protein
VLNTAASARHAAMDTLITGWESSLAQGTPLRELLEEIPHTIAEIEAFYAEVTRQCAFSIAI